MEGRGTSCGALLSTSGFEIGSTIITIAQWDVPSEVELELEVSSSRGFPTVGFLDRFRAIFIHLNSDCICNNSINETNTNPDILSIRLITDLLSRSSCLIPSKSLRPTTLAPSSTTPFPSTSPPPLNQPTHPLPSTKKLQGYRGLHFSYPSNPPNSKNFCGIILLTSTPLSTLTLNKSNSSCFQVHELPIAATPPSLSLLVGGYRGVNDPARGGRRVVHRLPGLLSHISMKRTEAEGGGIAAFWRWAWERVRGTLFIECDAFWVGCGGFE